MNNADVQQGYIIEVDFDPLGSTTTVDHAIGAAVISVEDAVDFDEEGGLVRIDDNLYYYDAVDQDLDTITLVTPLVTAPLEGELVQVWDPAFDVPATELFALVALPSDQSDDDPIKADVNHSLSPLLTVGPRNGRGEAVTIARTGEMSWSVTDVAGLQPLIVGGYVNADGLPEPVAVDAPVSSPLITIKSTSLGFRVYAEDFPTTAALRFYISPTPGFTPGPTNQFAQTRSPIAEARSLPDSTPLVPNATYYFRVIAFNSVGEAVPCPEVSAQLTLVDSDQISEIVPELLSDGDLGAVIAILGGLTIGNAITITPGDGGSDRGGIKIELLNGGSISLPADGSAAQFVRVLIQATALIVEDGLEVKGADNRIAGTLKLVAGVETPKAGPVVGAGWDPAGAHLQHLWSTPPANVVLHYDNGSTYLGSKFGTGVVSVVKATGVVTQVKAEPTSGSGTYQTRSITKIGVNHYVLYRFNPSAGGEIMRMRAYDASWVQIGAEWTLATGSAGQNVISISTDGTSILLADKDYGTGRVTVYTTTITGGSRTILMTTTTASNPGPNLLYTTADFGTPRIMLSTSSSTMVFPASGLNQAPLTANGFPAPAGSSYCNGSKPLWDGTRFLSYLSGGSVHYIVKLSNVVANAARLIRHSIYDSVGTAHETDPSPDVAFTHNARQWMKVTTPEPGNGGGADDPNRIRHYIKTAVLSANYFRQPDVTAAPWSVWYETPAVGTATARTDPTFAGIANPGLLKSSISDGFGALAQIAGDGSWRLLPDFNMEEAGWINLILDTGNSHNTQIQYNVNPTTGLVTYRGKVEKTTGTWPALSAITLVSATPLGTGVKPTGARRDFWAAGNAVVSSAKLLFNTDGSIQMVTGPNTPSPWAIPAYVSFDGVTYKP